MMPYTAGCCFYAAPSLVVGTIALAGTGVGTSQWQLLLLDRSVGCQAQTVDRRAYV